ncbi:MAG: NAD-dependent epimerase/dehydratase family protein [Bacteroidota bacterium]
MKTILGTGQLGIAVMEALLNANPDELITLVNSKGKLEMNIPGHVRLVAADVTSKNDMEEIARRSEVIFSCTDVVYPLWGTFYPATALALAHALSKTDAKLVFADNLYSYGNAGGRLMTEDMPHVAQTKKGMIRTQVITTLLKSGNNFTSRVAFVKAADFIGPRIYKGIFGTDFLDKVYKGKTNFLSGDVTLPHTFTYIRDFAMALLNVGNSADAFGQVWHVPNAPAMGLDKWIHLFEVNTNRKVKAVVLPKIAVRAAGLFNPLIKEFYELAYQFEHPYLVDHKKYVGRFGNHATSPSVIVKQTVQWYKTEKQIA